MRTLSLLLVVLLMGACSESNESQEQSAQVSEEAVAEQTEETQQAEEIVAVELATRKVSCGCAIESIGACGNYVEIDGNFAYIANSTDFGLGSMEWCGKEGVTAESSGELKGDQFYASTLVAHTAE